MTTEEALGVFWDTDAGTVEVDGFEVGGLWASPPYPAPESPAAPLLLWPPETEVEMWRMHGPGWVAPLWRFRIRTWPAPSTWLAAVEGTLRAMTESGAKIAWLAADHNFADPPSLFDRHVMGDRVVAALSETIGFVYASRLGEEAAWLSDESQDALMKEANRLVDLRSPDPDE
jgi:hypothetical protein